jgi:hypothetical protein
MNDSFGLGEPITGGRRPSTVTPFVVISVAIAIAATLVGAALLVMKRGGEVAAEASGRAVETVDRANDLQVQVTLQAASRAAMAIQAETGNLASVTPEALAAYEPAVTFTAGSSTGPTIVSVAVGTDTWGAASRSASGSCLWVRLDARGVVSYGEGPDCTGTAALSASRAAW